MQKWRFDRVAASAGRRGAETHPDVPRLSAARLLSGTAAAEGRSLREVGAGNARHRRPRRRDRRAGGARRPHRAVSRQPAECEMLVVVCPAFQNLGIGTELVRSCIDLAGELGFERSGCRSTPRTSAPDTSIGSAASSTSRTNKAASWTWSAPCGRCAPCRPVPPPQPCRSFPCQLYRLPLHMHVDAASCRVALDDRCSLTPAAESGRMPLLQLLPGAGPPVRPTITANSETLWRREPSASPSAIRPGDRYCFSCSATSSRQCASSFAQAPNRLPPTNPTPRFRRPPAKQWGGVTGGLARSLLPCGLFLF